MKMLPVVLVTLLGAGAAPASAQVSLDFKDGTVTLKAQAASVSQILAEWARRGRTTIINGERVSGPAVTIELENVPEQQALDIVLRGVSGYLVGTRETAVAGASGIDRVYILPTSSRPTTATALPQPSQPQQVLQSLDDDDEPQRGPNPGTPRLPPNVVQPGIARPIVEEDDRTEPENRPAPAGNPFGVAPGTTRPGVITPVPSPGRSPNQ